MEGAVAEVEPSPTAPAPAESAPSVDIGVTIGAVAEEAEPAPSTTAPAPAESAPDPSAEVGDDSRAKALLKKYRVSTRDNIVVTRIKSTPQSKQPSPAESRPTLKNPFVSSPKSGDVASTGGAVSKQAQMAALKEQQAKLQALIEKKRSALGFTSPSVANPPKKKKGRYWTEENAFQY
jgi:hypothetical protein